jgi:large subunit ribosomal protein L32e
MKKQFLRADTFRYKRLGSHSKKLAKWRRPRGKHNKLRLKRAGHPQSPSIGFGTPRAMSGKIKNLAPKMINNLKDLELAKISDILIISRKLGAKKKLEIIKKAEEKKIRIFNIGGKR